MPEAERYSDDEARNVGDFLIAMVLLERVIRDRLTTYLAAEGRHEQFERFVDRKPISDFVERLGWTTSESVSTLKAELRELLKVRNKIAHRLPTDAMVHPPLKPGQQIDPVKLFEESKSIRYWDYDGKEGVVAAVDLKRWASRAVSATDQVRALNPPP